MLCPGAAGTVDLHQPRSVWIALRWGMRAPVKACLFLLFVSGGLGAALSDTVNERVPVSEAELEAHWQVDCAEISDLLRELADRGKPGVGCQAGSAVRHQLQLCAFIYQAPGSDTRHLCPDYRGALEELDRAGPGDDCGYIAKLLPDREDCLLPTEVD